MLWLSVAIDVFNKNEKIHSIKGLDAFVGIGETVVNETGKFSVLMIPFLVRNR